MSAQGFAFERRFGFIMSKLKEALEPEGWIFLIHDEQAIRDFFKEQSLNGVDHMLQIQDPDGEQCVFFIQEKWKLVTNQREVSQFLDCCARILARMPDYKGDIYRLWVSRTVPSLNGEKSLQEGQCIVVQTCTSQTILVVNALLVICDILDCRDQEEAIVDPKLAAAAAAAAAEAPQTTFEPVSDFGEKRVLPITNKTVVMVRKVD
jgi:hypothetical protein